MAKTVPNEDLAVYDRVAGNDTTGGDDQQLVTTTEEPVDIVQRTLSPDTLPLEGRTEIDPAATKIEERLGERRPGSRSGRNVRHRWRGAAEGSHPCCPARRNNRCPRGSGC